MVGAVAATMFGTMLEAHDERYITDQNFMRTIPIPTLGISTTDFNITKEQKDLLFNSGFSAGQNFFRSWDFERYKKNMQRTGSVPRMQRLAGK